jgi:1,4-dihydroxy-2-naphthoate octaprenyltransferase
MSDQASLSYGSPWLLAIRLKTLPAAVAPVIVGSALAFVDNHFDLDISLVCLFVALLLQVGSNLANDVFDYEKGADEGERFGPTRVTQAGLLRPTQVKRAMWGVFGLTALLGLYLVVQGGWVILILGVSAILAAIAYTGGPYPFGYYGWGDLFVFVFFGLAATAGTYYLHTGYVSSPVWWMAASMGCLTVDILVVNNLRDVKNDRLVKKRTLAVRLGVKGAQIEYFILMSIAFLVPIFLWVSKMASPWGLLTWGAVPLAVKWTGFITQNTGKALNKALAGTGQIELVYAVCFSIGMVLSILTQPI